MMSNGLLVCQTSVLTEEEGKLKHIYSKRMTLCLSGQCNCYDNNHNKTGCSSAKFVIQCKKAKDELRAGSLDL